MRCACLGEAWLGAGLGPVVVWGEVEIPFVRARFVELGVPIVSAPPAGQHTLLLVDSYEPAVRLVASQQARFGLRVLVEDLGEPVPDGYRAVWNPNAYGNSAMYTSFRGTVIAGVECVPLRRDLPRWSAGEAEGTGIALGGGELPDLLLGALTRLGPDRQGRLGGIGDWVPDGWRRLSTDGPWAELVRCERVLLAGGSTVWEGAYVGIPCAVVQVHAHQRFVLELARHAGVPTLDVNDYRDSLQLTAAIEDCLGRARPMPPLVNGAAGVAQRLAAMLP